MTSTTSSFTSDLDLAKSLSYSSRSFYPNLKEVACVILSGGEGSRLHPLTLTRCKPGIDFGVKYKLIDVPISNAFYADCRKIYVLTQFLSSSLHRHLFGTYIQNSKMSHLIEILTAEQKPNTKTWYEGTADAVRQNLDLLLESPVEYFLILSGDQLYQIDFRKMFHFAKMSDADLTIAALPISAKEASRLGVLKINQDHFITDFYEKPQEKTLLQKLKNDSELLERAGAGGSKRYLGSMGIYLFKRKILVDLLRSDKREDFGKHLIPLSVQKGKTAAFLHEGYWEDIGTIQTFYEANLALTSQNAPFDFYNQKQPLFSYPHQLPPTKISQTEIKQVLLGEGSVIDADEITRSLIGPRSLIDKGCIIRDSYLMGNDYYSSEVNDHPQMPGFPKIGENTIIKKAIIDKNVVIGKGVQLINKLKLSHYNGDSIFIRDGIIVVPKGAIIPDGFIL